MTESEVSRFIQQIKNRSSEISSQMLNQCEKDICQLETKIRAEITQKTTQNQCIQKIAKWFTEAQKKKLKSMKDYSQAQTDENFFEVAYILILGVYATFEKKIPRTTQLICFWINTHSQKTILEVKTGEGKTMIVAMTALYYALRGKKVDVFTSSEALATTQTKKQSNVRKFYNLFGISLDENCTSKLTLYQATKVYKSQIIYGTSFNFQADYLRKVFTGQVNFFKGREFDQNHVAILDEVDALLIDRMTDSTRLSSQKPLYETIKMLFVLIYEVKTKLMRAKQSYGGLLTINILGKEIKNLNIQNKFLDEKSNEIENEQIQQIEKIVAYALQNDLKNFFPPYLLQKSSYINHMLKTWIKSSFQSQQYERDIHYIITKDRQIVPIDISTGTYQKNTKWSNGIHQFVQLRHGIQPSVDSLVTNYESNLIFFQRYTKYIYGMTGTISKSIGNEHKQQKSIYQKCLQQIYKMKIFKIPTFRKRLLKTEYPRLMSTREDWMQVLIKQAKKYSKQRKVLLIFKTIKQAKQFIAQFKKKKSQNTEYKIVELYDHDSYHQTMSEQMDSQKTIIVSTNLGGRGTDYQIKNQNILKNGGLFVMMTYFAQNWRIQQQAFGRAGRNGQKGSGAFYINIENYLSIRIPTDYNNQQQCSEQFKKLQKARQQIQKDRFLKALQSNYVQQTKMQILDKFIKKYITPKLKELQKLREIIENQNYSYSMHYQSLIEYYKKQMDLGLVEQQWGLFIKKKIGQNTQNSVNIRFEDFIQQYEKNKKSDNVNPGIITLAASRILSVQNNSSQSKSYSESSKLFERAYGLNKEWISKYYLTFIKLKKKQEKTVTYQFCNQLVDDLDYISNLMLIDLSINIAIRSHYQQGQQQSSETERKKDESSKQELLQTEKFFIQQISNLQTIVKTLKQYVIEKQSTNIIYKCSLKNPTHKVSRLKVLGLDKVFSVTVQQKKSGWKIFLAVLAVIVVTIAAFCIATCAALSGTMIFAITALAGVVCAIGAGFYPSRNNPVQVKDQASSKSLIQIYGNSQNKLGEQQQKLIKAIYQNINKQKQRLNSQLNKKLQLLNQLRTNSNSQDQVRDQVREKTREQEAVSAKEKKLAAQRLLIQAFSQQKDENNINKIQSQQKVRNQLKLKNCIIETIKENKFDEKIKQIDDKMTKNINKNKQSLQNAINNYLQPLVKNHNQQRARLESIKPQTQQQQNELNKQIDVYNLKDKIFSQNLSKMKSKNKQQINKSVINGTLFNAQKLIQNYKQSKRKYISEIKCLKEVLINIEKSESQLNENQSQKQNFVDFHNNKMLNYQLFSTDIQKVKNVQAKTLYKDIKDKVYDKIQDKLVQKAQQAQQKLQKQGKAEVSKITGNYIDKLHQNINVSKKTPISKPSQINHFVHYAKIIVNQCLKNKINVHAIAQGIEKFKQFFSKLNTKGNQQIVFLMDGAVFFKGEQKCILKIYTANLTAQLEKVIDKKCKVIYQNQETKSTGWSIITDVEKFIECVVHGEQSGSKDFGILSSSQPFDQRKMTNKYLQSILAEETLKYLQNSNPEIIQQRKTKGNGSLPMTYFPFELGLNSDFEKITNQIINRVQEKYFTDQQFKAHCKYISTAKDLLLKEQKDEIKQIYKDYLKFITNLKVKRVR